MEFFRTLGELTERLWHTHGCRREAFPLAAHQALHELPPSEHISFADLVRGALLADTLPPQADRGASFSDAPLTVFRAGDRFRIEVLFWVVGVPVIHHHAFSGAFSVLHGSSLHSEWTFAERQAWTPAIRSGRLTRSSASLLHVGDSRPIAAGPSFIHATFHLDRPSATVVVRTNHERQALPQFVYVPPGLAFEDPLSEVLHRRLQLLAMLRNSGERLEHRRQVHHLLSGTDPTTVFHVLRSEYLAGPADDRAELLAVAAQHHPELVTAIEPALRHLDRRRRLTRLRATIDDRDLQFFLALLLNVDEPDVLLDLVRRRHPDRDAIDAAADWGAQLAARVDRSAGGEPTRRALRALLSAHDVGPHTADGLPRPPAVVDVGAPAPAAIERLHDSWLFASLFAGRDAVSVSPDASGRELTVIDHGQT